MFGPSGNRSRGSKLVEVINKTPGSAGKKKNFSLQPKKPTLNLVQDTVNTFQRSKPKQLPTPTPTRPLYDAQKTPNLFPKHPYDRPSTDKKSPETTTKRKAADHDEEPLTKRPQTTTNYPASSNYSKNWNKPIVRAINPGGFYTRPSRSTPFDAFISRATYAGTGFSNLGNTCYMNVVLQVILSLPTFTEQLYKKRFTIDSTLPDSVLAAVANLAEAQKNGQRVVAPTEVKKAMGARSAAFRGFMQQDAHEFFCDLLDAVGTELASPEATILREPSNGEAVKDPGAETFNLVVQHKLTCSKCSHVARMQEEFNHLSLDLPENENADPESINQMLNRYFQTETVEKQCEHCSPKDDILHTVEHKIKSLPNVLALHIKRFKPEIVGNDSFRLLKLHNRVIMPKTVRLEAFCTEDVENVNTKAIEAALEEKENDASNAQRKNKTDDDFSAMEFPIAQGKLHAVISHHGSEAASGHYTVDIQKDNNRWVRFNDSLTNSIDFSQVTDQLHQKGCYMLFYKL